MSRDTKNYVEKPMTEFTSDDTLYMTKMNGGYMYTFLIAYTSFSKGIVKGKILDIQPNNMKRIWFGKDFFEIGSEISGRINKCYLFDNKGHWFYKDNNGLWTAKI